MYSEYSSKVDSGSPAHIYDRFFVPALFEQWSVVVCERAGITAGQSALDVACGTGALTCVAADIAGDAGAVHGLDCNPEMLAVARAKQSDVVWQEGVAESLPYDDRYFDNVVSQFGFMFFDDKSKALSEMTRVLKPGGNLVIAVCDAIDHSPGYAVLTELLNRLFGNAVAEAFRAPFSCGDRQYLASLCDHAGLRDYEIERRDGRVRFDSVSSLIATERACAWTLGGCLDDAQFEQLLDAAEESLYPFVDDTGVIEFTMPALIISANKP